MEDQAILETIQSIKNSQTQDDWWDELTDAAKEGIKRGEADVKPVVFTVVKISGKRSIDAER